MSEWAAQTCFTKSFERKKLHFNRSVLVERIYLIVYFPVSLPRFPSPRKKCVLFKSWASWLALLSAMGGEGAVSFFKIVSPLHLHIHTRHCITEVGESSFLYLCMFLLILLDTQNSI